MDNVPLPYALNLKELQDSNLVALLHLIEGHLCRFNIKIQSYYAIAKALKSICIFFSQMP